ncbi:MAG TPA: Tet(A)/Tet(B)/Tet(C) family tetracycline efflux MFS transporter [Gemmatimonadaceae bacterium]|jgi:DHA1 family tetracycline resistance protein-like MFS transporter
MSRKPFPVVLGIIALDAVGIGLVLPFLPTLLRSVLHVDDMRWHYGAFLSLYALLQFLCAPILGALSDRYGRRPVLLLSLTGAVVNYAFMAVAPSFGWLLVGRAVGGLTAANASVAAAYLTDITPESGRARTFGYLSAAFGVGFIVGPAMGGLLVGWSLRAPFIAGAILNALNLLATAVFLDETHHAEPRPFDPAVFHPLAPLRWAFRFPEVLSLLLAYAVMALIGEVGGTVWVLYGQDKFHWDGIAVGLSLAGFGVFHALAQAFVAGPVSERWGERTALLIGIICDGAAYIAIAFATKGWFVIVLYPFFCVGGIGAPALQSLLTAEVDADRQGELQGVMTSVTSLASVIGPLVISQAYFASRTTFPGLVWLAGAALYVLCLPVLRKRGKTATELSSPSASSA